MTDTFPSSRWAPDSTAPAEHAPDNGWVGTRVNMSEFSHRAFEVPIRAGTGTPAGHRPRDRHEHVTQDSRHAVHPDACGARTLGGLRRNVLWLGYGQAHDEGNATRTGWLDLEHAAVEFDQGLGEGEPEVEGARPSTRACLSRIATERGLLG